MAQSLFTADELVLEYPEITGLVTPLKTIKLGYILRNHPDIDAVAADDIQTFDKKSVHFCYRLTFLDDASMYLLIKNKGDLGFFYPRFRKADYLLCSVSEDEINKDLISTIRNLNDITVCFALDKPNQKEILNFTQLL